MTLCSGMQIFGCPRRCLSKLTYLHETLHEVENEVDSGAVTEPMNHLE